MARLKVMTWNVLYKEAGDNILELIKKINPDVLCCQEITNNSYVNLNRDIPFEISQIIGNYRYAQVLSELDEEPGSMGNAIFSKLPIVGSRSVFLQKGDSTINSGFQNRLYLEVELQAEELITIGTTHLSYTPGFIETPSRERETDRLLQEVGTHKEKYIITGDFNAGPDSNIIKKMGDHLQSAGPPHTQNTFSTKPFNHNGFIVDGLEWRLDYIFTTPDINVQSSNIVNTDFSDHLPIVAEIEV